MSNEFEKAKQEIERIEQEAEQSKRDAAEAIKRSQAAETLKKEIRVTNLATILKVGPNTLQKLNEEVCEGKGVVSEWENKFYTYHSYETVDYVSYPTNYSFFQLETRLEVPKIGDIIITIPTNKIRYDTKYVRNWLVLKPKQIIVPGHPIPEKDKFCRVLWTSSNKSSTFEEGEGINMSLSHTDEPSIVDELTAALAKSAISLHTAYHSQK